MAEEKPQNAPPVYAQPAEEVARAFSADVNKGLNSAEAQKRLQTYGINKLPEGKEVRWWELLLRQFTSPLVYILVIAAVVTSFLEEWLDTIVILLAVLVNTLVGFFQEFRAGNVFKALSRVVTMKARVLRDGSVREVESSEVVPGDILALSSGMKVPADARLLSARELKANEALLTGESLAVDKTPGVVKAETPLAERSNMVFTGTVIERGEAQAIVTATGASTELGKIAALTERAGEHATTPLQERMARLGKVIAAIIGVSALIIFAVGLAQEHALGETFTLAVAVAVAGIPEGLPAAMSVVLAVGMQRVLRKKGLVKKLIAAETLGSTNVICTDKTGTLTEGTMKVEELRVQGDTTFAYRSLALANEALVEEQDKGRVIRGDATDRAKMEAFFENGGDLQALARELPRKALLPFSPERKYLASFHGEREGGAGWVFVTGAPEVLLSRASTVQGEKGALPMTKKKKQELEQEYEALAQKGYRMIAVGWRRLSAVPEKISQMQNQALDGQVHDITFGGLAALGDPIRKDVPEAMRVTREAGIHVVMVTGDHKLTAVAIGEELGFAIDADAVMEGEAMDALSDQEFFSRIDKIAIFSRVTPAHKMRIIEAWQKKDKAVAMTGDGVNDAPALKAADIGVAVGTGTDVTKEAADLVLLNDSFATITEAVRQGRVAFDNIRKVAVRLLTNSFTELILVLSSLLLRVAHLPVTAAQILWVNLVEGSLPDLALAFEPEEPGIMKRKPFPRKTPILNREARVIVFFAGILTDLVLVGVFLILHHITKLEPAYIQTIIFSALGTDTLFVLLTLKSLRRPIWKINIFNNRLLVGAVCVGFLMMGLGVYVPVINTLLGTVPLIPLHFALVILGFGALQVMLIEAVKGVYRHVGSRQARGEMG